METVKILGFTGTRIGMTSLQQNTLRDALVGVKILVHGNCIGADDQANQIAMDLGIVREIYPSNIPGRREHRSLLGALVHAPSPPLVRNKRIVKRCDLLFAAPRGPETVRSGTWATIRYARKVGKRILVVMPNGILTTF
ncbi:MAG: hypothetical protein HC882_00835 [Acidobacteria bacterium]|nr:hypothetical protein [Acidobacteriota bacterium]